ncbi:PadR family transcriptional regulator [Gordonia phthalatica]|uniref:Transcriptional regulator n=1 Tax=Gordonia phthalatica TaxID=1136941 RepID=A0A0N9MZC7_9ACTN|nr:PadR family transcriptional regulator [Gordonia phthalatica]ALG83452.1 transcriptional regulator [Gordonia phthalatica]
MPTTSPRLTPLAVMVLALLREDDMHPYEMVRVLKRRRDDRMVSITNGTLYHTVGRLHEQQLVVEVGVDREGNRPERTTYSLTEAGRGAVVDWVRTQLPQNTHPDRFRVALAEAHNLDRTEVISLLTQRRDALTADLDTHLAGLGSAADRGVPDQFLVEVDRQRHLIQTDLAWTENLLTRLADPAFAWGVTEDTPPDPLGLHS